MHKKNKIITLSATISIIFLILTLGFLYIKRHQLLEQSQMTQILTLISNYQNDHNGNYPNELKDLVIYVGPKNAKDLFFY